MRSPLNVALIGLGDIAVKAYLPVLAKTAGHKGVTGTIAFDEKGDIKNGAISMFVVKEGKLDYISTSR